MQITIQATALDNASDWRAQIEDKVLFALRRLRHEIRRARISLRDINGPRGGVDKECRITLTRAGSGQLVVTSHGRNIADALHAALDRVTRSLLRSQKREQRAQRQIGPRAATTDADIETPHAHGD